MKPNSDTEYPPTRLRSINRLAAAFEEEPCLPPAAPEAKYRTAPVKSPGL